MKNPDKKTIQNWLIERISQITNTKASEIDPEEPFVNYRIDSILVVTMASDLEKLSSYPLDPTVFWEYENISELAEWLAGELENSSEV